MKGWIALTLATLAVAFLGGRGNTGTEIARLRPVEVLQVERSDGLVCLKTDMGDSGVGEDVKAASEDLLEGAPGEVFLDTAEYLLVDENALELLPELMPYLRPSCMVCLVEGKVDLEQIGAYLQAHPLGRNLAQYRAGEKELEILRVSEGDVELVS